MDDEVNERQQRGGQIFVGLVIVVIGLAMLGERTGFDGLAKLL